MAHQRFTDDELQQLADELDLDPIDLGDAVYEAANEVAAQKYNDGAYPGLDDESAHGRVHDDADIVASNINNEGVTAQLRYLADSVNDIAALRSLVEELIGTSPGAAG